jgi:leukotriene-A4 hydrolase
VYFEGRIIEALYGKERREQDEVINWQDLMAELDEMGRDSPRTALGAKLTAADDPEEGISGIPYIKGASFLRALEAATGRERFDAFLHGYFTTNGFSSMSTERFLELVKSDLLRGDEAAARALDLETWAFGTGMPASFPAPRSSLLERADVEIRKLAAGAPPSAIDVKDFNTWQWVHLLRALPRKQSTKALADLDRTFRLSASMNREIRFEWLRLAIANRYEPAIPSIEEHLTKQSRRRLVLPIYEDLVKSPWGRAIAERVYKQARPTYHSVTARSVDEALSASAASSKP